MKSDSARNGWIVRTGNDYLFPKGKDVGYTPNLADAGSFETKEASRRPAIIAILALW